MIENRGNYITFTGKCSVGRHSGSEGSGGKSPERARGTKNRKKAEGQGRRDQESQLGTKHENTNPAVPSFLASTSTKIRPLG